MSSRLGLPLRNICSSIALFRANVGGSHRVPRLARGSFEPVESRIAGVAARAA
jgi:hypothetical protein